MKRSLFLLFLVAALSKVTIPNALGAELTAEQQKWYADRLDDNAKGRTTASPSIPLLPETSNPVADKLVTWDRLRRWDGGVGFQEFASFLLSTPGWPQENILRQRAEQAIKPEIPMADRLTYFEKYPPLTAYGKLQYAEALLSVNRGDRAADIAREAWIEGNFAPADEQRLLNLFRPRLTPSDHLARIDHLLWRGSTAAAKRNLSLLDSDHQAWANARIALRNFAPNALTLAAQVPTSLQNNAGFVLDLATWHRRKSNNIGRAVDIMLNTKVDSSDILYASNWLEERQTLYRWLRDNGDFESAYRILAEHQIASQLIRRDDVTDADRVAYTDTEWQAGWLALRTLKRPQPALKHFQAVYDVARTPITLSKAAYWAGQAAETNNNALLAQSWYKNASQFPDFFYGQLAVERLGGQLPAPSLEPPAVTAVERAQFAKSDLTRAALMLGEMKQDGIQALFIRHMASLADTPQQKRLIADLTHEIDRPDLGVTVGKFARGKGIQLAYAAYPRIPLKDELTDSWTMIHAIARQESLFNTHAVSKAGARGLMQLMPGTALQTSKQVGVPFDVERLTSDPSYNMSLGSAFFSKLLARYQGNHVLAVAAYNAGPGNVSKWLARFGDPRDPTVNVVDWIEQIPFQETRTYVQRVLENAVVYSMIAQNNAPQKPRFKVLSQLLGNGRDN